VVQFEGELNQNVSGVGADWGDYKKETRASADGPRFRYEQQ
jgi:hypothetical protein